MITDHDRDEGDMIEEKVCCSNLQTIACTRGRVHKRKINTSIVTLALGEGLKMYMRLYMEPTGIRSMERARSLPISLSTRARCPLIPFT